MSASAASTAVRAANARFGGGLRRRRLVLERARAARSAARPPARAGPRALEQAIEHVTPLRRDPASRDDPDDDRPGHRDRAALDAARSRRRATSGRLRRLPVVARDDRRPGPASPASATIVVASPADRDGDVDPVLLGAAGLLGVDALLVAGGAQAIGALAFGLRGRRVRSPVDRIVGPGNAWVTAAKLEVGGDRRHRPAGRPVGGHGPRRRRPPIPCLVAADLVTPGRARSRLAGDPRHDRTPAFADAVEARDRSPPADASNARDDPRASPREPRPDRDRARPGRGDRLRQRLRARAPVGRRRRRRGRGRHGSATRARIFVGPWAPESRRRLRDRREPRPADRRPCPRVRSRSASRRSAVHPGPAHRPRRALARIRDTVGALADGRGPDRPSRTPSSPLPGCAGAGSRDEPHARHHRACRPHPRLQLGGDGRGGRRALRRPDRDDRPVRPEHARRRRPTSSPSSSRPADSKRRCPSTRRPTTAASSSRGRRRYGVAAGRDPRRAPGPTRSSTSSARRSCRPADRPSSPTPDLRDVPRRHRATRRDASSLVPRLGGGRGWAIDVAAVRAAAHATPTLVWLCSPNNPTGLAEPDGAIEALLDGHRRDAAADGRRAGDRRPRRGLRRVRRRDASIAAARRSTRTSSSSGPRARPMRSPACGSGSRSPGRETIARIAPYRPPGSVSTVSASRSSPRRSPIRTAMRRTSPASTRERDRLAAAPRATPAGTSGRRSRTSSSSSSATPERAAAVAEALLRRGLVPRTFGAGHPLADCPPADGPRRRRENDRLIAAAAPRRGRAEQTCGEPPR